MQGWQCFFIVMLAFAVSGFMRGFRREIVSLAFTLAAVLIVFLHGGDLVAQAIFVHLPVAFQNTNALHAPSPPSSLAVNIVTALTLILLITLGYFIGNRAFPRPTNPAERIFGAIPAIISGIAIFAAISTVTTFFSNGTAFTFALPTPDIIGNYLLLIFIVLVVLIIVGLVTSSARKKSGGAKPK
jgi:lysylphosphatidylglycerol synthetase-like protein (DUF2156 family)